ncbi:hypothetical protein ACFYO5_35950 [Streptomyces sp. NPDC006259]|uniref:hypothetical protein n=1 Tax=Streptomyces sp. NPDC006259 TaxID=3364740 RepID=UPI0036AD8034
MHMQPQQPSQAPVPPASPAPIIPPASSKGPLVAALLVGLLVGGAGVGTAWALTGSGEDPSISAGPAADARGACAALAGFDASKYAVKGDEGQVALYRWNGAVVLSEAAATADPTYKPLADALRRASQRHQQVFEFDAQVNKDIAQSRKICAGL